jgi:aminodeoxyfutalosine deaminase
METHPLTEMLAAGVLCSISTDDPAMFGTDLTQDYEFAARAGCSPEQAFRAGIAGALCDAGTRSRLQNTYDSFTWSDNARLR